MKHRIVSTLVVASVLLLSACIGLEGSTNCHGGQNHYRWTIGNKGEPVEDFVIDSVSLDPDESGGGGPHFWVGETLGPDSYFTHIEYDGDAASAELTVVGHYVGSPTVPRTVKATATNACP